jgi:hypothetical protein
MCSAAMHSHSFLIVSQGPTVQGKVSLTCDAWQASNADGYFAVTAHWIEEQAPTSWDLKSTLIGFTCLNSAHNGQRLGHALFKIIRHMGIQQKVSVSNAINDPSTTGPHSSSHREGWPCYMQQRKQ